MPFKHYHGRTGVVFNVTKRAIGVRVNKFVNGKILEKLINVRMEHLRPSKCRDEIKKRIKENEAHKKAARTGGGVCTV
jgi:large subunit ribosomal protein L21e